jgi:hypothetical protein
VNRFVANCRAKVKYSTRKKALAAHMRMRDTFRDFYEHAEPYKCKVCGRWHLTTKYAQVAS